MSALWASSWSAAERILWECSATGWSSVPPPTVPICKAGRRPAVGHNNVMRDGGRTNVPRRTRARRQPRRESLSRWLDHCGGWCSAAIGAGWTKCSPMADSPDWRRCPTAAIRTLPSRGEWCWTRSPGAACSSTSPSGHPLSSPPNNRSPSMTAHHDDLAQQLNARIAEELGASPWQVAAAVALLDGGATVPFIARYRKEATGSLDDAQLRLLAERLDYLRELAERRAAIVESITAQGKLTDALAAQIAAAETKARLEDIYLPFKPKRRTKAQIAREAGLEPLADLLIGTPNRDPAAAAAGFVDSARGVEDAAQALTGARAILTERFGEDPDLVGELRELLWARGRLTSTVRSGAAGAGDDRDAAKFADYFEFSQPVKSLPSHRILAMYRGEAQGVLTLTVDPEPSPRDPADTALTDYERRVAVRFRVADRGRPADRWLLDTVRFAWRTRILLALSVDVRTRLRQSAERDAAAVFAANLKDLLLAAPAGARATLGLDPGFRTGVKVAVVDGTGKVVAHDTIYPHQPANRWDQSLVTLDRLVKAHR